MEQSFNLLEHYPDRWRGLREIQAICDTDVTPYTDEDGTVHDMHTLQHLYECMEQELNNSLIIPYDNTGGADEYTVSRWEKMLGITPDSEATLEDRIFVINIRLFQTAPYSIRKIQHLLDSLLGEDESAVIRDVENKTLKVILDLSSRFKAGQMREMLDNTIPANMGLTIAIAYTTHNDMAKHTHEDLSHYTHDEIVVTEL